MRAVRTTRSRIWLGLLLAVGMSAGCAASTIPPKFVGQADRTVRLADLKRRPESYDGKVIILGGVIIEKRADDGQIWLLVKNRPLDGDFVPHMPVDQTSPEAGSYWILLTPEGLPKDYEKWARITVVGRVTAYPYRQLGSSRDPVLIGMYLRGWDEKWGGYGATTQTWEAIQSPNAILSAPKPVLKKE